MLVMTRLQMKAIEEDLGLQELCETLRYKIFFQRVSVELRDYSRDDNKSSDMNAVLSFVGFFAADILNCGHIKWCNK